MQKKEVRYEKGLSPGQLYSELGKANISEQEETELKKKADEPFVKFCKRVYAISPSMGAGAKYTEEYKKAIDFLGWDLKPEEFSGTIKFFTIVLILIAFAIGMIALMTPAISEPIAASAGPMAYLYLLGGPILLVFIVVNFIQKYPINAAADEKKRALTYVPQIIGYLIMSLKLVPNLEKAIEFAAEHGKGKIADDFKVLLWNVQIGVFNTVPEALDDLAYRWGDYSSEFKEALMMIRASILEDNEAKRYSLLDKTMVSVLESIRGKMEQYARDLSQPANTLFYVGVLLPLILIIILPIGSVFSASPMASPLVLAFIYNIAIPGFALMYARNIVKGRPPTYTPPYIPDNYPTLPKKWAMKIGKTQLDLRLMIVIVLIFGLAFSWYFHSEGMPPKSLLKGFIEEGAEPAQYQILAPDKSIEEVYEKNNFAANHFLPGGEVYLELKSEDAKLEEKQLLQKVELERMKFFSTAENDITPYNLLFGVLLTIAACCFVYFHYRHIYKRKIQLEIMEMEHEFKDSLYILASRLGENRPVEEALDHTRRFLPNLKISDRIFGKTIDNIKMLGLTLESAVFHPRYGSLVAIPSDIIRTGMKILVDSVRLGVNVASRTLISLCMQLENSEKVTKLMRDLISDISMMMVTISSFIAPAVLGITSALQKVVMNTLASIVSSNVGKASEQATGNIASSNPLGGGSDFGSSFLKPEGLQGMATPFEFLVIIAIYVIELVIIMNYFTTKIEEDNDLTFKLRLAKALPIAITAFTVAVIAANLLVGGFMG